VAVREPFSLEYLQGLGLSNINLCADAIFASTPPPPDAKSLVAGKILINDSFRWKVGWPQRRERVKNAIAHLKAQGHEVVYFSILSNGRDSHFAESLGLEYFACDNYTDYLAQLQSAAFILTGRFHTAVFAAVCAAPFLAFEATTYKVNGLLRTLEYRYPSIDFMDDAEQVTGAIDAAIAAREEISAGLRERLDFMSELALKNVPT
jgi:polysaccharide pyruvyl transferase WcaK-like protein